jgi:NAD(P)-dependent dehydrogenase (short-subunit alcohol dehydrogenase family)
MFDRNKVPINALITGKVALNALTRIQQKIFDNDPRKIIVNAVDPGFVATDINKNQGILTPDQGK